MLSLTSTPGRWAANCIGESELINVLCTRTQVGLVDKEATEPFCGGSIITRSHVLTAAHCVVNINTGNVRDPGSIQVIVGAHDTTDSDVDRRDISTIRTHPQYRDGDYDAAILFLSSALTFTSEIAPVCLPVSVQCLYSEQKATVTGWGLTGATSDSSQTLQEVDVFVASNEECSDIYPNIIKE